MSKNPFDVLKGSYEGYESRITLEPVEGVAGAKKVVFPSDWQTQNRGARSGRRKSTWKTVGGESEELVLPGHGQGRVCQPLDQGKGTVASEEPEAEE